MNVNQTFSYYDGKRIAKVRKKISRERQLWLLDNHPCFTGICGNCGYQYPDLTKDWTCPECGFAIRLEPSWV